MSHWKEYLRTGFTVIFKRECSCYCSRTPGGHTGLSCQKKGTYLLTKKTTPFLHVAHLAFDFYFEIVLLISGDACPALQVTWWLVADGVTSAGLGQLAPPSESLSHGETSPTTPEPGQERRRPRWKVDRTWHRRYLSSGSGGGEPGALGYLFIYLLMYLFPSPVMAGLHGCGCWEAGAVSPTKAFRSSAWPDQGRTTGRPAAHRVNVRCDAPPGWRALGRAASGGDTTGDDEDKRGALNIPLQPAFYFYFILFF